MCKDTAPAACHASGYYYNDNDTTTDLHGELNRYHIIYSHRYKNFPKVIEIQITALELATNHIDSIIN